MSELRKLQTTDWERRGLAETADATAHIYPDRARVIRELLSDYDVLRAEANTLADEVEALRATGLTFRAFRGSNVARALRWHPEGLESWSPSDWLTALAGEVGELASLLKMRNRERDGLDGNKFSPTDRQIADELADVFTYLDLLAAVLGVDLGLAAARKFNEVSERVGFPERLPTTTGEEPSR